jgi:ribosome recycling factor
VWDKNAVGAVAKAIENAKVGLTVTTDGGTVRAMLSPLGNERREELCRLVKKETEGARIRVRAGRDEAIKKLKTAEDGGGLSEDSLFKTKEKVQKLVDEANARIETALSEKIKELGE